MSGEIVRGLNTLAQLLVATRSHRDNTIVTPTHVASSVDGNGGKYSFFNSHDQKIIKYEIYFKAF